jgi:hypothetical protein
MLERMREMAVEGGANVTDLFSEVFEFSFVTNVKTETRPKLDINHVRVLYALNEKLLPLLKKKLRPPLSLAERSGRMVAKVTYKFEEKKGDQWVSVYVNVKHNNLLLTVGNHVGLFPVEGNSMDGLENLRRKGQMEYFNQLYSGFLDLEDRFPAFTLVRRPDKGLVVKKGTQVCEVSFQTYVESPEILYTSRFTETLSDFIIDFMVQSYQMSRGDWK